MPLPPYVYRFNPPMSNLDFQSARLDFHRIQWERDEGLEDRFALDITLQTGELLVQQCEFLEAKLNDETRDNVQLSTRNASLVRNIVALETGRGILEEENRIFKQEYASLKAVLDTTVVRLQKENKACKEQIQAVINARHVKEALEKKALEKEAEAASVAAGSSGGSPYTANQPMLMDNQPMVMDNQPMVMANQPMVMANQPMVMDNQPMVPAMGYPSGGAPTQHIKREAEWDPTFDDQHPRQTRRMGRMGVSLNEPAEDDATYDTDVGYGDFGVHSDGDVVHSDGDGNYDGDGEDDDGVEFPPNPNQAYRGLGKS